MTQDKKKNQPAKVRDRIIRGKAQALRTLQMGWSQAAAARNAGISRQQLLVWRDDDKEFDSACLDAIENGTDVIEDVATSRVKRGKSDMLTMFLLNGRRPDKYRPKTDTASGGTLTINVKRFSK